jgi:hypothetical protein
VHYVLYVQLCSLIGDKTDYFLKNDGFTTPLQQLHNNPSHGVEPSVWGLPSCEELLYNCCTGEV